MAGNKFIYAAIVILLVTVGFLGYYNYCSQPGAECPVPIAPGPGPAPTPTPSPTPTPTRTPISPTPTPTPTPGPGGITFKSVSFEDSSGDDITNSEVTTGTDVMAVVTFTCDGSTEAYVKVEWVKDVPYAPDTVVATAEGPANFYDGDNDIRFGPFTDEEGTGNYFIRVYAGPSSDNLERVDPWTDPISNPDRPEVEFVEGPTPAPTPTPTKTPVSPSPTPISPTPTPAPGQGELEHVRTDFTTGGPTALAERICVADGATVSVTEYVKAVGGDVSGTMTVKIREDFSYAPDSEKTSFSKYIDVEEGQTKAVYMGSFTAKDEAWNFRQYFPKVWMNYAGGSTDLIYNPQDPDTREAVCVYPNCGACS